MINFIIALLVLLALVLVWLMKQHKVLKQEVVVLSDIVNGMKDDVAGLCSAAVSVDSKLADNNEQLMDVVEKIFDFEKNEHQSQSSQPYHGAIQKIRNGANAEELMQEFSLSREEAILLVRLHGQK